MSSSWADRALMAVGMAIYNFVCVAGPGFGAGYAISRASGDYGGHVWAGFAGLCLAILISVWIEAATSRGDE